MMSANIYHEKQVKELCALHALNNLFQVRGFFTKNDLDSICNTLSPNVWINPHRSLLGLGNYDVNVIMAALQKKGYEAIWFDKRKDPACLNLTNICGFILNVPSDYKLGFVMLPLKRRHWVAIRQIQGTFYNLDSKLQTPQLIGRENALLTYLRNELDCKSKELFVVVTKEIEEKQTWQLHLSCEFKNTSKNTYSEETLIKTLDSECRDTESSSVNYVRFETKENGIANVKLQN